MQESCKARNVWKVKLKENKSLKRMWKEKKKKSMQRKELASKEKENQEIRHNWPRKERKEKWTTQFENKSSMHMYNCEPGHLEVWTICVKLVELLIRMYALV